MGLNYQAVARDQKGDELVNRTIDVRMSIISGNPTGMVEWEEIHSGIATNPFGLFTLVIGGGIRTGGTVSNFDEIPWSGDIHFLKVEIKFDQEFLDMGTAQFLSVPYALFSRKSLTPGPAGPTGPKGDKGDPGDPASDDQTLSLEGNILRISNGNSVTLYFNDADADPENEIQYLTLLGDSLLITKGNGVKLSDFVDDADADPSNELQNLSLNGYILSISSGNTITLRDSVKDEDADPMNEIQDLQLYGNILKITNKTDANNIYLNSYLDNTDEQEIHYDPIAYKLYLEQGGDTVDLSGLINDEDADPGNELQIITISNDTIYLSNGGFVKLPADQVDDADPDPANELITGGTLNGTNLEISDTGGTTTIDLSPLENIPLIGFRANKTGVETILGGIYYTLIFDVPEFEYGGDLYNPSSGIFIVPEDQSGLYSFTITYSHCANQTLKIFVNSFEYEKIFESLFNGTITLSYNILLNDLDEVYIQISASSTGDCGTGSFSGFRVH